MPTSSEKGRVTITGTQRRLTRVVCGFALVGTSLSLTSTGATAATFSVGHFCQAAAQLPRSLNSFSATAPPAAVETVLKEDIAINVTARRLLANDVSGARAVTMSRNIEYFSSAAIAVATRSLGYAKALAAAPTSRAAIRNMKNAALFYFSLLLPYANLIKTLHQTQGKLCPNIHPLPSTTTTTTTTSPTTTTQLIGTSSTTTTTLSLGQEVAKSAATACNALRSAPKALYNFKISDYYTTINIIAQHEVAVINRTSSFANDIRVWLNDTSGNSVTIAQLNTVFNLANEDGTILYKAVTIAERLLAHPTSIALHKELGALAAAADEKNREFTLDISRILSNNLTLACSWSSTTTTSTVG